jgi:quercetin dioxygenase-like cupin family protein
MSEISIPSSSWPIPDDDPTRSLALKNARDHLPHLGIVGDTYTIVLSGEETAGRFCLIDMHVPPGGGPPPHRHDFGESFLVVEGQVEATFRGQRRVVSAGETIHIPANAPHQFRNASSSAARMFCICSPAGQEQFFLEIGHAGRNPYNGITKADGRAAGRLHQKGNGTCSKVSNRAAQRGALAVREITS